MIGQIRYYFYIKTILYKKNYISKPSSLSKIEKTDCLRAIFIATWYDPSQ